MISFTMDERDELIETLLCRVCENDVTSMTPEEAANQEERL